MVTRTFSCNPASISTIVFESTGTAFGPYEGTFRSVATAVLGPFTGDRGNSLRSLVATFTIDSPAGQVTGTFTRVTPLNSPSALAGCWREDKTFFVGWASATYTAAIRTGSGVAYEQGTGDFRFITQTNPRINLFNQAVNASFSPVPPG